MPDVAGVTGGPDDRHDAESLLRTKTSLQEVIDDLSECRQLVEVHELSFKAGVVKPVRLILTVAEQDLRAVDHGELMPPRVVGGNLLRIGSLRFLDVGVLQLPVTPAEDDCCGVGECSRSEEGIHDDGLRLPAASRPAVEDLVRRGRMKDSLFGSRLIVDSD